MRVSLVGLVFVLLPASSVLADRVSPRGARSAHPVFERVLQGRGEWRDVAPYGRVWKPDARLVGEDFTPYGNGGRWKYTELGWSFESTWDWGWVPFHYGRWANAPNAGWVWVPDTEWAPAWVDWRAGDGWVGWAPLPPGENAVDRAEAGWTFVRLSHFVRPDLARNAAPREQVAGVFGRTAPVHDTVARGGWYHGPAARWRAPEGEVIIQPAHIVPPRRGRIDRARIDP